MRLISYLKQTLKGLHEERKRDVPLPVYIFWWVVRILVIQGAIKALLTHEAIASQMLINVFVCFMFTFFKLFPKEKFLFSRFSFKLETIVIFLNLVTTYLGSYIGLFKTVPAWDMIVHFVISILGVYFGYEATVAATKKREDLAPVVGAICGIGLSSLGGILWEIYEFTIDQFTARNTQHWIYPGSNFELIPLTDMARYAVYDTMTDLIAGFAGAMAGACIIYLWLAKRIKKAAASAEQANEPVFAGKSM